MTPEQTVFIVDDDAAIRRSLRFLLESVGLKTETYSSAEEFLQSYDPARSGCLILDVRMPGMNGLNLQEHLVARQADLPIIIVTAYAEVPMAVRALKKGAVDFIEKPFSDQLLIERVSNALDLDQRRRTAAAERGSAVTRLAQLTPREREVMDGVVAGKSNKVIAMDLRISEKTVEAHRSAMMRKMGVDSVADLIRLSLVAESR